MLPPSVRSQFSAGATGYLDTPSMGLPTMAGVRALTAAAEQWGAGHARFQDWEQTIEDCRSAWAWQRGIDLVDVGTVASVTSPLGAVFSQLTRGDGVMLAHREEFRSLLLPALATFGNRIRWVSGDHSLDSFAAALDTDVRVVAVSSVSSATGARIDLAGLVDAADAAGAVVVVDSTQSEGIVPLGADYGRFAAVAAAAYKGLLGGRGSGFVHAPAWAVPTAPPTASPYGMSDNGVRGSYGGPLAPYPGGRGLSQSPAWLSWAATAAGLDLLGSIPQDTCTGHVLGLSARLRGGLADAGMLPQDTDLPSSVVTVAVSEPRPVLDALAAAGIRAAVRLGRLRLGLHVHNTEHDVDRALEAILALDRRLVDRGTTPERITHD